MLSFTELVLRQRLKAILCRIHNDFVAIVRYLKILPGQRHIAFTNTTESADPENYIRDFSIAADMNRLDFSDTVSLQILHAVTDQFSSLRSRHITISDRCRLCV